MDAFQTAGSEPVSVKLEAGEEVPVNGFDQNLVDFVSPQDPEDPLNWSSAYKWSVVILISVMSLVV